MEKVTVHQVIVFVSAVGSHKSLVSHSSSALVVIFHLAFTLEDQHLFLVCQHFLQWFMEEATLEYKFSGSFSVSLLYFSFCF